MLENGSYEFEIIFYIENAIFEQYKDRITCATAIFDRLENNYDIIFNRGIYTTEEGELHQSTQIYDAEKTMVLCRTR